MEFNIEAVKEEILYQIRSYQLNVHVDPHPHLTLAIKNLDVSTLTHHVIIRGDYYSDIEIIKNFLRYCDGFEKQFTNNIFLKYDEFTDFMDYLVNCLLFWASIGQLQVDTEFNNMIIRYKIIYCRTYKEEIKQLNVKLWRLSTVKLFLNRLVSEFICANKEKYIYLYGPIYGYPLPEYKRIDNTRESDGFKLYETQCVSPNTSAIIAKVAVINEAINLAYKPFMDLETAPECNIKHESDDEETPEDAKKPPPYVSPYKTITIDGKVTVHLDYNFDMEPQNELDETVTKFINFDEISLDMLKSDAPNYNPKIRCTLAEFKSLRKTTFLRELHKFGYLGYNSMFRIHSKRILIHDLDDYNILDNITLTIKDKHRLSCAVIDICDNLFQLGFHNLCIKMMTLASNRDPVYLAGFMDGGFSPPNNVFSSYMQEDMFTLLLNHRVFGYIIFENRPLDDLYNHRRDVIKTMKKCNKRSNYLPKDIFQIVCKYVMY